MRISSLLKTENDDVPDQVLQFIFENTPENTESIVQAFLQLIVDLMGVDFIVTLEMVRDPSFHRLLMAVRFNLLRTDYASKEFVAFQNFVTEILRLTIENNILEINVDWLAGSVKFLEALSCDENAKILLSLLSLPFLISFSDNFAEMRRLNLEMYWDPLFENVKAGMSHPEFLKKVTEEMCALSQRCNTVNLYVLLPFHTEGLKIQHIVTNLKILKNIKSIFRNALLDDEQKKIIADYFASSEPSLVLFHFMFEKSITIVKETFEVISYVHDYVHTIPSWTSPLYNLIYYKIFHRNQSIRILAANFFLKRMMNIMKSNEGEILIQILEFYFQYQPSMIQLPAYIDNLWGFQYMHNFKNIFTLLTKEATPNLIVCHFIVSVAKKMQADFDLYKDEILYLLKTIPLLLKDLQKQKYPFGILLEIFIIVDVNLYSAEFIGDLKYFERAANILCQTFLKLNHGYKVQSNIFYVLDKFIEMEFCDITLLVCETVAEALQMFESVFLEWEGNEFEVNENSKTAIQQSVCNMCIIIVNSRFLDKENIRKVFKIMQKCFLERDYFEMFGYTKTRSMAILLTSELFKRIVLYYLQYSGEALDYIPIAELKESAKQFMLFLEIILQRKDENKYYKKTAYKALISVMLLTQQILHYNKNENLRVLCIDVTPERYLMILDFVQQSIHPSEGEYSLEDQKDILRHCAELHKYHIGIPALRELWAIMIQYGYLNNLENELFEVVKAILKSTTPTEEEGIRFSRLFPIIITLLVEQEKNAHTVEIILQKYFNLIEEHSSNKNVVVTLSILNVINLIGQRLKKTTSGNINRLKVLKYLTPFLHFITQNDYKEAIKARLPEISKHFTANESSTLKDFETTLLPESYKI